MEGGEEIEIADENEFPSVIGRKYSPVVAHDSDSAVIEMTYVRPGSSSSLPNHDLKYSLFLSVCLLVLTSMDLYTICGI